MAGTKEKDKIICVVVGDHGVGKETLLNKCAKEMAKKHGVEKEAEAVNGTYIFEFPFKGVNKELRLLSISGEEKHKVRRKLCYWEADIFLVCFSVVDNNTSNNAETLWVPEIQEFCREKKKGKSIPLILVGTQTNKRTNDKKNNKEIKLSDGMEMARQMKISDYIECGEDKDSVTVVFAYVCNYYMEGCKTK